MMVKILEFPRLKYPKMFASYRDYMLYLEADDVLRELMSDIIRANPNDVAIIEMFIWLSRLREENTSR